MRIGFAAALALVGLTAAGCADLARVISLTEQPLDRTSPVAAQVEKASNAHYKFPNFRDVPPAPPPATPPGAFRTAVAQTLQQRAALDTWVAANPPLTPLGGQDPETFAAGGRARIPAGETGANPPPVGTEDYAAQLRALATPPPPPK